jgi:pyranose oxidase
MASVQNLAVETDQLTMRALEERCAEMIETDVFIAGSGPVGATFARNIVDKHPSAKVFMAEIGSQDSVKPGTHHKNSIKYQLDIDKFVSVIQGALQPVSVPTSATYMPTLDGVAWAPTLEQPLIMSGHNPAQKPELNLGACAVTRTVGGMATHWTCAVPRPHLEESKNCPFPRPELDALLDRASTLINMNPNEFDESIRHRVVRETLNKAYGPNRPFTNLPLAVKRNENKKFVTWSGADTVFGETTKNPRFTLKAETRVTRLLVENGEVIGALLKDLQTRQELLVKAKNYVIACGSICTPQILFNSYIRPDALGKYLTEQTIAFCQIVLKKSIVDSIRTNPEFKDLVEAHKAKNPTDPLPIPFDDPEPQVTTAYSPEHPWHTQIHRDAFSYGDVGPRADPRVIVDLRYFGKTEIKKENRVEFSKGEPKMINSQVLDMYGMPQATFVYQRSDVDAERDHRMMQDMCTAANHLGGFLPGSEPQFMEPGLTLHITGTTRAGKDEATSVVDASSKVHNIKNLYLGGNNVIPDETACNPTLTSMAYALKASDEIVAKLGK